MATVKQRLGKGDRPARYPRPRKRANRIAPRVNLKLIALAIVGGLLVGGIYAIANLPHGSNVPAGSPAPDFTLTDSTGRTFSLSDFRGRPVVLFFMTTSDWCVPCKVETRDGLRPLQDNFGQRVQIISIEVLPKDRSDADLNAYRAAYGSNWIYARDTAGVSQKYGVTALSTVIIVDQNGYIRFAGADPSYDQLASVVRSLGV